MSFHIIAGELGDYDPRVMVDTYVSEFRFVPDQVKSTSYQHFLKGSVSVSKSDKCIPYVTDKNN